MTCWSFPHCLSSAEDHYAKVLTQKTTDSCFPLLIVDYAHEANARFVLSIHGERLPIVAEKVPAAAQHLFVHSYALLLVDADTLHEFLP